MKKLMFAAALVASAAAFADGPINAVSFAGGVNDYQFNTQGALFYFDGESDSSTVTNEPAELIHTKHTANFAYQAGVTCTAIDPDGVRYLDPDGNEKKQMADNVLLAIGMKSKSDEAMALSAAVPYSVVIGDCDKPGNVQKCMRAAFGAASQI